MLKEKIIFICLWKDEPSADDMTSTPDIIFADQLGSASLSQNPMTSSWICKWSKVFYISVQ